MALFSEEDGMPRVPATSPCRRDYQLRSFSSAQLSEYETSRPQSPWLPRVDRGNSCGGAARSYYSGPLPSASPMPSYFSGAALPEFLTTQFRGRPSEVMSECSSREEEGDVDEVGEVLYASYLKRKEEERNAPRCSRMGSLSPVNSLDSVLQGGRMRNCVSGELGTRSEVAEQRAQTVREYKSGEIVGLEISSDGIYPSPEMRSEVEALVKVGREISMRKQRSSVSVTCEASGENGRRSSEALAMVPVDEHRSSEALAMVAVDVERSNSETAMVEIPFKWEEMPVEISKKAFSRASSVSRPEARITKAITKEPSYRFYGGAKNASGCESDSDVKCAAPAPAKLEKSSSVSSSVSSAKPKRVLSSAVPFKWEVEPGKPKVEEKASRSPGAAPALQLPPRLASASSSRRSRCSTSAPASRQNSIAAAPSGNRAQQRSPSLSAAVSSSLMQLSLDRHRPIQDAKPRRTLATVFRFDSTTAGQSDCTPQRGPISSQFGSPQYQSVEYLCEDSVSWNRVRSPTSTLCGPGSDSHSTPSSCKSDKSSRQSSVSFSHSQSGTSAESFEQWSYGDHISPTSRHPSIREFPESEESSRANSARGVEDGEHADGKITKLRRKLNLKSSSSKPPMSPIRAAPVAAAASRPVDLNGYSSHGEEYFDCQGSGSSPLCNPKHSDTEEEAEAEPPTRLPYKMPSPVHDIEPKAASASSSPTRGGSDFSNCLALPKFLSRGEPPCLWVENPSWDLPTNTVEDGYRSPAYKATLELLSPSPNLMAKKAGSRAASKLPRCSSARRRHPHLVEVLCNSLRQSLQRCTKRSVARTQSIVLYDDQFSKRHQSFMW